MKPGLFAMFSLLEITKHMLFAIFSLVGIIKHA